MNEEIKEILSYLDMYKNMNEGLLNSKDKKILLNYITNLQQENERLKKNQRLSPEERQHFHLDIDEIYEILIDYKSRCEKASEILKKLDLDKYTYTKENRKHTINNLLNILQNGSENQ